MEKTQELAAAKAGMDVKTARKYLANSRPPSEQKAEREWRTRRDPFEQVWEEVRQKIDGNPGLEAKTLFEALQRECPGEFADGGAPSGPADAAAAHQALAGHRRSEREVFFGQKHVPGRLGQSDFTYMNELGILIGGQSFPHMLYHFVLTYSNWEDVTLCYSESFESLSEGLQDALWELGGVPLRHQTDRLSTAVNNMSEEKEFTNRYEALMRHYRMEGQKIQAGKANENGDVEQRHHRLKRAVEQALLLRDSRDFPSVADYKEFLRRLLGQLNAGRRERLAVEMQYLQALPARRPGCPLGRRQASEGEGRLRQHRVCGPQRLLGEQPADRRAGGSSAERRDRRGLVCRPQGGTDAALARPWQASGRLPAYYRLAGAQAGRLRELPLSRGVVSHEPVPHGVGCVAGTGAVAGRGALWANATWRSCKWRPRKGRRAWTRRLAVCWGALWAKERSAKES